jgi:hypothetical protein
MRPRIHSAVWTNLSTGEEERRWHVDFIDTCGCDEQEDFATHDEALRFARHVAAGGSRWEFVA